MEKTIIHVDMDAFFASVEERDNPELRGKPLIIGALPHERGVVSTCNYEARRFGVHSAMSIKEAYRRCPNAVFMHGNMAKYEEASDKIHKIMLKFTDKIEFVALDEGYMDVSHSLRLFKSAENIAKELKKQIFKTVGVTCSVGISYSMMGAKLASEEKKPNGFFVIKNAEELTNLIRKRPVRVIFGIGAKTEQKLKEFGIVTVEDLLNAPKSLIDTFGKAGREMINLANGIDEREVIPDSASKSIGREHTFQQNIMDKDVLRDVLLLLSRDISLRIKRKNLFGKTVTLKIKYSDMSTITRSKSGRFTNSAKDIFSFASELFDGLKLSETVRLIGVTVSNLSDKKEPENEQLSLFDDFSDSDASNQKTDALEDTIFDIHSRFGRNSLKTAKELKALKNLGEN